MLTILRDAGWPVWPLILASMAALALIIERFISLQSARVTPPQLLEEAMKASQSGVPSAEVVNQLEQSSVLGAVLATGLRAVKSNPGINADDLRATLEGAGRTAAHQLDRYLAALATIASVSPLMGLLGTIVGMIEMFSAQSTGTPASPANIAHGISVALYTTAIGLMIAIPTLLFWRYFRGRVDAYLLKMEVDSERFLRHLLSIRKK
ncbi:MAG: MotA/TolQ/ExbB proton channel family protein [Brachymonas sp.]|nr:MotA/TolQ/ExbB proton channel family protein [Brachymonas sp.]